MPTARRTLGCAAALLICALGAQGCSKVHAKTPAPAPAPAEPPPLSTPEPPTRLKLPVIVEAPPPAGNTTDKPAASTTTRGKPPVPPSSTAPPPATPPDTTSPPVIQASAEVEKTARERLARAEGDLKLVQPRALSPDAREQFESAKRFVLMTHEAIKARNFVYAAYCADKAATLASLLVKERQPL